MSKSKVFFKELMYRFPTIEQMVLGSSFFAFPFLLLIEKWGLWATFAFLSVLFLLPWLINVLGLGIDRGGPIWTVVRNYKTWVVWFRKDEHPRAFADFRLIGGWFKDDNGVTYGKDMMISSDRSRTCYRPAIRGGEALRDQPSDEDVVRRDAQRRVTFSNDHRLVTVADTHVRSRRKRDRDEGLARHGRVVDLARCPRLERKSRVTYPESPHGEYR